MGRGGMRSGAGRPPSHVKAEHCKAIDVRRWHRDGLLRLGHVGGWRWWDSRSGAETGSIGFHSETGNVTLTYCVDERTVDERISLVETPCHFGGSRPWFQCPRCAKRVAKLFLRGSRFACRACSYVVYASQSDDACGRAWRRQTKLEGRLGPNWTRPKGMHRKTRTTLLEAIWACEMVREDAIADFVDRNPVHLPVNVGSARGTATPRARRRGVAQSTR